MTSERQDRPLGLGVAGLGRGFMLTAPSLIAHPGIALVAAAAPRAETRAAFEAHFGGHAYESVAELCGDPAVEAIYIATPHQMHAEHVADAARAGKHVLVEKPLAVSMDDGENMVRTAEAAGIHLLVGPSHSFDGPIELAREIVASGRFGRLRMIQSINYTDFLYRPRRPEELITDAGGGVIFSQAVHQIDCVRLLAGGRARSVTAMTGAWDPSRATEGAYSALIDFEGGAFASLTYSGYAHFDSDEWMDWVGELGQPKDPEAYGRARRALETATTPDEEAALKRRRTFGQEQVPPPGAHHEHFGPIILSCEGADLRLTPKGVWIYGHHERRFQPAPDWTTPRQGVLDRFLGAIRQGLPVAQDGRWGLASLELCHAILKSARDGQRIGLHHQVAVP